MNNDNILHLLDNINTHPLPVFSAEAKEFLAHISSVLMKSKEFRLFPDLASFAFWARKKNIEKLEQDFNDTQGYLGRGLCFHIAPSNIPVNFAFSFAFSLLAGNANIVRLPSKNFAQVSALIQHIEELHLQYASIRERTAFINYARDSEYTKIISEKADARMIWGGDATIGLLKSLSTKPRCLDLCFADRYSVALIDGDAILTASADDIHKLAQDFYNDTLLVDQNACSSPQLILWLNASVKAKEVFWSVVRDVAKKYELQDATAMDKYTHLWRDIITLPCVNTHIPQTNTIYRIELECLQNSIEDLRGQGGYFYEYSLNNLEDFIAIITEKYQTITYFGVNPHEVREKLIQQSTRGIDRIVPIGRALDMQSTWDGFDIIKTLSRKINVA